MVNRSVYIDIETRSQKDLRRCGAHVYARDKSTDIICLSWAFSGEDASVIAGFKGLTLPEELREHVEMGGEIIAHNVAFEYQLWNEVGVRYGWPELSIHQLKCTMQQAYTMGLPGSLEAAVKALGLPLEKDDLGRRIMLQLAKPKRTEASGKVIWVEDPEKLTRVAEYCRTDVLVTMALDEAMIRVVPEKDLRILDHEINNRGVGVDDVAVSWLLDWAEHEKTRLDERMRTLTQGAVATCTASGQLLDFMRSQKVQVNSVDKENIAHCVATYPEGTLVGDVARLRQKAAKSSTAKLLSCKESSWLGRMHGLFQYHGAATGRWAGRRFQLQNLPQKCLPLEVIDEFFSLISIGAATYEWAEKRFGSPLDTIKGCIRGVIIPGEGHEFFCGDFAQIESRVLAWLADDQDKLDIFRSHGKVYEYNASKIYRTDIDSITPEQRLVGKTAELSLGFGGSYIALLRMARNLGAEMNDHEAANLVRMWRGANQKIVRLWRDSENAAKKAIRYPGEVFKAGKIFYRKHKNFLLATLPSGRFLFYANPRIELNKKWPGYKIVYEGVESVSRKWQEMDSYGGLLVQNQTQAVARDLLAAAMLRLEKHDYKIVATIHDEILSEVPLRSKRSLDHYLKLMSETPGWAQGLPVSTSGWQGARYRK